MPTIDERLRLIEQIAALPNLLAAEVERASDSELDTVYRDGGWTVRQVVHHLADSHMNSFIRMRLILTEEHPTLRPYNQDDWARIPESRTGPVSTSLEILRGLHARWSAMLRALPEEAWARTGFHPEDGNITLDWMLECYAAHGANHLGHVRAGLARARRAASA